MRNHTVVLFGNNKALDENGFTINRRLVDLATDPATRLGDNPETFQELFEKDYQDVYSYLQRVMFDDVGEVVWTFASQLERAGHSVYKIDIGIGINIGHRRIEIASLPEAKHLDADSHRYTYLLPTQLREMEASAKADHRRRLTQATQRSDELRVTERAIASTIENNVMGRPDRYFGVHEVEARY